MIYSNTAHHSLGSTEAWLVRERDSSGIGQAVNDV